MTAAMLLARTTDRVRHPRAIDELRVLFTASGIVGAWYTPWTSLILSRSGFGAGAIGVILAIVAASAALANPAWGGAADNRLGTTRALRIMYAMGLGASLLATLVHSVAWATAGAMVLIGVALAPWAGLTDTLALRRLGDGGGERYGSIRLFTSLGWGLTVWVDGALLERAGMWWCFPVFAIGMLVMLVLVGRLGDEAPIRRAVRITPVAAAAEAFRAQPLFPLYLTGLMLISTATFAAWSFVPLRLSSPGLLGTSVGVAALAEVPFMYFCAAIARRVGLVRMFAVGAGGYAVQMVLWAVVANPVVAAVVLMTRGPAFAMAYVGTVRISNRLLPANLQNSAQLLTQMVCGGAGPVAGALLGGLVYAGAGPAVMFMLCAGLVAIGTLVVRRAWNRALAPVAEMSPVPATA